MGLLTSVTRTTAGTSAAIDTTGASLIVLVTAYQLLSGATPSDNYSNFWSNPSSGVFTSSGGDAAVWILLNPSCGSGHTFTIGGNFSSACIAAFSGFDTRDQFAVQPNTLSPDGAGPLTPNNANSLIVSAFGGFEETSVSNSDTNINAVIGVSGVNYASALAYSIEVGGPSSQNPLWTWAQGNTAALFLQVFNPSAAGGATWPGYQAPFGWH